MIAKTLRVVSGAAMLTIVVMGFQNCGATRFSQDTGATSMKSSGTSDQVPDSVTNADPVSPNDPEVAFSGACALFKDLDVPNAVPASAHDVRSEHSSSVLEIPLAKDLFIANSSNVVTVGLAETASLVQMSGSRNRVRAAHITKALNISGSTCLVADQIDHIEGLSAGTKIVANSIDHIVSNSADLHVYRALINHVSGSSGRICLHEGASIADLSNDSGGVFVGHCR